VGALAIAVSSACAPGRGPAPADDRPLVLTTFTVMADIARVVAGNHLRVDSITKVGAEIHGYEPTPGDVAKAAQADLILDNGLNLEMWFAQFVESADVPHVVVTKGVRTQDITEDAYAGKPNPHAWMSPLNVQVYVDNIVEAFSALAPRESRRSPTARCGRWSRPRVPVSAARSTWTPCRTLMAPFRPTWT
jgi:manganese transport system substrate-binding protein